MVVKGASTSSLCVLTCDYLPPPSPPHLSRDLDSLALLVPLSALILPYIELGLCSKHRQTSVQLFSSTPWR